MEMEPEQYFGMPPGACPQVQLQSVIVNGVDHTPTPAPPLTAMMYQWSATVKGSKRTVYGDNALTDDLTGDIKYRVHGQMKALAKGQVQAAIQTLIVARGGTAPAAIAGSIEQLKQQLGEERQKLHYVRCSGRKGRWRRRSGW